MIPAERRQAILRVLALALVAAAFAYAALSARRAWTAREGSSNQNAVVLACTKCEAESVVTGAQFNHLANDPATGGLQCPKCGALQAYVASLRCPKCHRAIPRTPGRMGTAFVCPFCQASLAPARPQP